MMFTCVCRKQVLHYIGRLLDSDIHQLRLKELYLMPVFSIICDLSWCKPVWFARIYAWQGLPVLHVKHLQKSHAWHEKCWVWHFSRSVPNTWLSGFHNSPHSYSYEHVVTSVAYRPGPSRLMLTRDAENPSSRIVFLPTPMLVVLKRKLV